MSTMSGVMAPLDTQGGGRSTVETVGTVGFWARVPSVWEAPMVAAMAAAPARDVLLAVFCPAEEAAGVRHGFCTGQLRIDLARSSWSCQQHATMVVWN